MAKKPKSRSTAKPSKPKAKGTSKSRAPLAKKPAAAETKPKKQDKHRVEQIAAPSRGATGKPGSKSASKPDAAPKPTGKKGEPAKPSNAAKAPPAGSKKAAAEKPAKPAKSESGASGKESASSKNQRGRSVAEAANSMKADAQGYVYINGRRIRMISTSGKSPPRKSRAAAAAAAAAEEKPEPKKPLKTWLSKKQLDHYRDLLLNKRIQLVGDLNALEDAALRSNGGDVSHMPIHMADVGTDTYDQDFALGMAENERQQLREIDEALQRIEDKTYGVCMLTGSPIPEARLDAKPWAKYTIEAARKLEGQYGR